MAPPSSSTSMSTPPSRVGHGPSVKNGQGGGGPDASYFSAPTSSSAYPVTTPIALSSSSYNTPSSYHTARSSPITEIPPQDQPDMLQRLAAFFPPPPTLSLSSVRHSHSHSQPQQQSSPHISTSHRSSASRLADLPSPMDRSRRSPPPTHSPTMNMTSSRDKHTLHVQLPTAIQPEMITVSANKGDKLKVVADAWHMENDCHYEWQISFPPHDIDMSSVHAKFEANGHLVIDIRRISQYAFHH